MIKETKVYLVASVHFVLLGARAIKEILAKMVTMDHQVKEDLLVDVVLKEKEETMDSQEFLGLLALQGCLAEMVSLE